MKRLGVLSEADFAYCKVIAGIRRMANRGRGTGNYFDLGCGQNNTNEELGVLAEYAFCKYFNIFFDGTFAGKDAGYDCILHGKKIDIKAIDSPDKNLVAYIKQENAQIDLYVLILVEDDQPAIVGWIEKDRFIQDFNKRDLGYGERYFLPQDQLNQWG